MAELNIQMETMSKHFAELSASAQCTVGVEKKNVAIKHVWMAPMGGREGDEQKRTTKAQTRHRSDRSDRTFWNSLSQ